jgi:succinyl-CoA synthetase beta subunit
LFDRKVGARPAPVIGSRNATVAGERRAVKIHEYQAKEVLERYGVPVPRGRVTRTPEEAVRAAEEIGGSTWVLKAQIHAGGRGKGGGIQLVKRLDDVVRVASQLLGMRLVTPQTGPEGRIVRRLLVAEACSMAKECYVGIVVDRRLGRPVLMASAEGGVDIEEVAARSPEKIVREPFGASSGLQPHQARKVAVRIGVPRTLLGEAQKLLVGLSEAFLRTDATLAEVNPLVLTSDGRMLALDAKFALDDNALFRHPELREYRDLDEEDPQEVRASRFDLSYIKLEGSIGCLVNGAGLAMGTLDIIQFHGGHPANFLDVGGGATAERVTEAFKIILDDPSVRAILVNIFGGIMKCDVIASGILAAARSVSLRVPLVVRLEGTNVEKGREMLRASDLKVLLADGLADAAKKAVSLSQGGRA